MGKQKDLKRMKRQIRHLNKLIEGSVILIKDKGMSVEARLVILSVFLIAERTSITYKKQIEPGFIKNSYINLAMELGYGLEMAEQVANEIIDYYTSKIDKDNGDRKHLYLQFINNNSMYNILIFEKV